MSDLRDRRALPGRGLRATLAVLALFPLLAACGSGDEAPRAVPAGIDLPAVGTLGRQPAGPGTIVVDVTADGRISIGDEGPLSLLGLRAALAARTADPKWHEPDRSSLKILLVNADASLPWAVAQWIMQTACDPEVRLYRIFFGARARGDGRVGALGWKLAKDGPHRHVDWVDPPRLSLRILPKDGPPSDPADLLPPLWKVAGERPMAEILLEIKAPPAKAGTIPTGFVVRVVDVALRAGVEVVRFGGAMPPTTFDGDDVEAFLDHVAELRRRMGSPVLHVGREIVDVLPSSARVPPARGRLDTLHGADVEKTEPGPKRMRVTVQAEAVEEELDETEEITILDPVIRDEEFVEHLETDSGLPYEESLGRTVDTPFTGPSGSAGPPSGAFPTREREGERTLPVERALTWLANHQSPGGGWSAEAFGRWCDGKEVLEPDRPDGWGSPSHDVGVTGLALCAFLGGGYTNRGRHAYAKTVAKGLRYLKNVQDAEGCFGPRTHPRFVYDHAAAALAMVEAYGMTGSPIFKGSAQKALDFVCLCRNPGLAWRYGVKPGDNDTSVTAWMVMPLVSARMINEDAERRGRRLPLRLDGEAFDGAWAWLEAVTDRESGRTGYVERGGPPDGPAKGFESTTAAAIFLRALLGEDPRRSDVIATGAALLAASPPGADSIDPLTWYFGTHALFQVGGEAWKTWNAGLRDLVISTQRTDTDPCRYEGSWDPLGPWGGVGGRVASTALMAMCLEVHHRYDKVFRPR